ncbi:MAG: hypothetical protein U9R74_19630 [Pseudomonadota bacterium]|nr:hypothetical protein [Pseudomonadota bacterium]
MPFLSLLDDRAKPKGSRDPLGFELVWTHYGRQIIGNLTTITSSLGNFAAALLGFHWANEIHGHLPEYDRQSQVRDTFLRYEQLAGYLRYLAGDEAIMGITRVRRRMDETNASVGFGLGANQTILSDQASYGLWGLYSAAMRDTGLVRGDSRIPTDPGAEIAREIGKELDGTKNRLIDLFTTGRQVRKEVLEPLSNPFHSAINREPVKDILLHALMRGSGHKVLQQELWRVTQNLAESGASVINVPGFIAQVRDRTKLPELKRQLTEIEQVERILVAANNIFHYCRRKDGEPIDAVVSVLSNRYSYAHLPDTFTFQDVPRPDLLTAIYKALLSNDMGDALTNVLTLNRVVMEQRGGVPWVEVENGETLRVRVQSEVAELRKQGHLETGWDYDYFIGSFIRMAGEGLGVTWTAR